MITVLFLHSLGPDYSALHQQITSQSTLPSIEEVYSRAVRYTSNLRTSTILDSSAMVACGGQGTCGRINGCEQWNSDNSYRGRGHGRGFQDRGTVHGGGRNTSRGARDGGRANHFCTHYQLSGHTIDYCYMTIPNPGSTPSRMGLHASIDTEPWALPLDLLLDRVQYS
ncbi:hypothetical protein NL676_038574 [Syzygium grande]|nr:hypothetical protein NL676_038574 [Syzygium grande]